MDAGLLAEAIVCLEQLAQEHSDWFKARAVLAEAYYRSNQWQSREGRNRLVDEPWD